MTPTDIPSAPEVRHRCKVRQSGKASFFAYCKPRRGKCDFKGPVRTYLLAAWMDARKHDPDFPQGDTAAERAAV